MFFFKNLNTCSYSYLLFQNGIAVDYLNKKKKLEEEYDKLRLSADESTVRSTDKKQRKGQKMKHNKGK